MNPFKWLAWKIAQRIWDWAYYNNHNWWEEADLALIEISAKSLKEIMHYNLSLIQTPIYVPWVGCGNGKLDKKDVRPILEKYLSEEDKFIVISNE